MAPRGFLCRLRHVSDSLFLLALRSRDLRCSGHEMLSRAAPVQNIHREHCERVARRQQFLPATGITRLVFSVGLAPRPEAYCQNFLRV